MACLGWDFQADGHVCVMLQYCSCSEGMQGVMALHGQLLFNVLWELAVTESIRLPPMHAADVLVHVVARREHSANGVHSRPGSTESSHIEGLLHSEAGEENGALCASDTTYVPTLCSPGSVFRRHAEPLA